MCSTFFKEQLYMFFKILKFILSNFINFKISNIYFLSINYMSNRLFAYSILFIGMNLRTINWFFFFQHNKVLHVL